MKSFFLQYRKTYCLALLLLTAAIGFAQTETKEFSVNGLKVILHQTQKETLVMSMYFRGGTSNYTAANAGIESLALSGVVECGTSKFSANDFNDQTDEYGFHLGGEATCDYGVVKFGCISKYVNQAWQLFSSAITSPVFEAQKFYLLKEQKINQLKGQLSDPDERLKQLAKEFSFANSSYAINPGGTVASLTSLNRDAVKDYYYKTLLNRKRMFLVVAGNISKEDLEKKIQDDLASIRETEYAPVTVEAGLFKKETYKVESRPIATNYVCAILNAPSLNSNDYPAYRLSVTLLNSAMYDILRLERQLSYAPYADMSEGKISYVTLYASTTQPKEAVEAMRYLLDYIKERVYSNKTLNNIRKNHLLSYKKRQEIMTDVADELGKAEILGDWKLAENLAERMSSVTAEQVQAALNYYTNHITWAYIGNKEQGEDAFK